MTVQTIIMSCVMAYFALMLILLFCAALETE